VKHAATANDEGRAAKDAKHVKKAGAIDVRRTREKEKRSEEVVPSPASELRRRQTTPAEVLRSSADLGLKKNAVRIAPARRQSQPLRRPFIEQGQRSRRLIGRVFGPREAAEGERSNGRRRR